MVKAYILVITQPGTEASLTSNIAKMEEVRGVDEVYGEYDIIITVEVPDMKSLETFVTKKLRKFKGVEKTTTMITTK